MLHTEGMPSDIPLLNMLRMPFYFMLSGLFFKDYGVVKTILKKINKLIIPFLFFYVLTYVIYWVIAKAAGSEFSYGFFSVFTQKKLLNVALWFLLALFWANVAFMILYRLSNNIYILGGLSLLVSMISIYIFSDENTELPLFIDAGISVLPFFYLGYMLKSTRILYPNRYDRYGPVIIVALVGVAVVCYIIGDQPYIAFSRDDIKGNPYLFFLGASSIAGAFILLFKRIGVVKGVRYIGRYSLIILGVHFVIGQVIVLVTKHFHFHFVIPPVLLFIATVLLSTLMIPLLIKFCPKFTAQSDLIDVNCIDRLKRPALRH